MKQHAMYKALALLAISLGISAQTAAQSLSFQPSNVVIGQSTTLYYSVPEWGGVQCWLSGSQLSQYFIYGSGSMTLTPSTNDTISMSCLVGPEDSVYASATVFVSDAMGVQIRSPSELSWTPTIVGVQPLGLGAAAASDWTFSGDSSEYKLSSPTLGVVRINNGQVSSATRTPLDVLTTPSPTRAIRPTLFISIPGANFSAPYHGTTPWQTQLSSKLSTLINTSQYKHFMVDWESLKPMQGQVNDVSDAVKEFLRTKQYAWDVVIVGHSRGGVFAHELAKRLAGYSKISKLHSLLLDPTAATSFGDVYPTQAASGSFGYLKYDGLPFSAYGTFTTFSDQLILGYTNYGLNNFQALLTSSGDPQVSHENYPYDWLQRTDVQGFGTALTNVLATKDNGSGSFVVDGDSGNDVVVATSQATIGVDLDAQCVGPACTFQGTLTVGPLGTVTLSGMVATQGVDAAVSTAFASASAVLRRDQIMLMSTDLFSFSSQSQRINLSGITVNNTILNGYVTISNQLSLTQVNVSVKIGNINVPVVSHTPLDVIIPGASVIKKLFHW